VAQEDEFEPEPVLSFAEVLHAFQAVKSFFYRHSISERDEKILNMESSLCVCPQT
jgi:hypothetical protein